MAPERVVIGDAELWCGDCRDILPTLADKSVDFGFFDPPYGHNNNDGDLASRREVVLGNHKACGAPRPISNDGPVEANALVKYIFGEFARLLSGGGCCCCCCGGGGGPDPQFARWSMWLDDAIGLKQMVVWDKGPMGMGWHYRRSYETILVGEKRGGKCRWYDTTKAVENIIRPSHGIRKIIPLSTDHPTTKPPGLAGRFIGLHTLPGHLVLDPTMGAGTTGVAAILAGRRFIGIELERRWFDMACERIAKIPRTSADGHR